MGSARGATGSIRKGGETVDPVDCARSHFYNRQTIPEGVDFTLPTEDRHTKSLLPSAGSPSSSVQQPPLPPSPPPTPTWAPGGHSFQEVSSRAREGKNLAEILAGFGGTMPGRGGGGGGMHGLKFQKKGFTERALLSGICRHLQESCDKPIPGYSRNSRSHTTPTGRERPPACRD